MATSVASTSVPRGAKEASSRSGFPSNHPRVEQVYDLGRVLGKGSFSTVYLGVHKASGEEVALKVIPAKNYRRNERAKQLLRTEVAVMSRIRKLHHPNLMNFKHTFEDAEKIVMVLEILSGGELFDRIVKKGHYSERDASLLTGVLVRALGALHSVGVLHRDLKPENCIYSTPAEDSPLKITDFGLAALVTCPTERLIDKHLVGTPGYICPAVLTGYEYSAASDMWAVGVILFILLSGSPPFYGRTHKEIFEKIKSAHWGFHGRNWSQVSDGAKDLVKRMLRQNPAERLTVEEVLDHPWIREHESVSAEDLPGTLESLKNFSARQKFRAAAMVCIGSSRMQQLRMAAAASGASSAKEGDVDDGEGETAEEEFLQGLLSAEELENLKIEFGRIAAENAASSMQSPEKRTLRKALNLDQFKEIMTGLHLGHLPLERMFQVFDTGGTGDVDYREFLVGMSKFRLQGSTALKFCFDVFDEDNSGALSREELTKVLVHSRRKSQASTAAGDDGPRARKAHVRRRTVEAPAGPAVKGPVIVQSDDGEVAHVVGEGGLGTDEATETGPEAREFDPRYMEMDAEAYEEAESIAQLFESLDTDNDNQVTLEEFLEGAKRHPELCEVFLGRGWGDDGCPKDSDVGKGGVSDRNSVESQPGLRGAHDKV